MIPKKKIYSITFMRRYRTFTLLVLSTLHIQVHKILKLTLDLELVEKEVETSKILMFERWDVEEDQTQSPSPFVDLPPSPTFEAGNPTVDTTHISNPSISPCTVDFRPNCTFEAGNPTVDTTHISNPSVSPCTAEVDSMPRVLNLSQPSPSLLAMRRPSLDNPSSRAPPVVRTPNYDQGSNQPGLSSDNVGCSQQSNSTRLQPSPSLLVTRWPSLDNPISRAPPVVRTPNYDQGSYQPGLSSDNVGCSQQSNSTRLQPSPSLLVTRRPRPDNQSSRAPPMVRTPNYDQGSNQPGLSSDNVGCNQQSNSIRLQPSPSLLVTRRPRLDNPSSRAPLMVSTPNYDQGSNQPGLSSDKVGCHQQSNSTRLQPSPSLLVTRRASLDNPSSSAPPVVSTPTPNYDQGSSQPGLSSDNVGCRQQSKSAKSKASHIQMTKICIGTWKKVRRVEDDLVAKIYFAKKKLVWELLDEGTPKLKKKMEIRLSDITAFRSKLDPSEPGLLLQIELARPPSFYEEIPPLPLKHTNWQQTHDFTQGQAKLNRRHYASFPTGALDKHLKVLLESVENLSKLSRKPFPTHGLSPYFNLQQPQPLPITAQPLPITAQPLPVTAVNYPRMGYGRGQHTAYRKNQLYHYYLGSDQASSSSSSSSVLEQNNNQMIHQNPSFLVDQTIQNNANINHPIIPNVQIVDDRVRMMQQPRNLNVDDWLLAHITRPNYDDISMLPDTLPNHYANPNPNPNG